MRYWVRTLIGLAICCGAVVAFDNGLYHLIRTGSCASGGPYVSARPCPPGTALHALSLVGGIFAGLIGIAIYASRGKGGRPSPVPLAGIMWALLFCSIAATALLAAFGPANNGDDGTRTMAVIFGLVFVPMGLAPIPLGFLGKRALAKGADLSAPGKTRSKLIPDPPPIPTTGPAPFPSQGDALAKLERLGELKKSGVLTDAEFEQQKKKLLGEI